MKIGFIFYCEIYNDFTTHYKYTIQKMLSLRRQWPKKGILVITMTDILDDMKGTHHQSQETPTQSP